MQIAGGSVDSWHHYLHIVVYVCLPLCLSFANVMLWCEELTVVKTYMLIIQKKKIPLGAVEMTQWLRVLTANSEDLGSIPSTHVTSL